MLESSKICEPNAPPTQGTRLHQELAISPALQVVRRLSPRRPPFKRYFKTEREAKVFASDKIVELLNEGVRHGPITERERRAIYVAREARVDVTTAIEAFIEHRLIRQRSVTVERAGRNCVERREAEGKSRGHVKDLRMRFRAFCAAHEGRLAADITTADVDAWLASFIGAPQTRLNIRRVIHNLFSYCVASGYAASNPVTASIRPGSATTRWHPHPVQARSLLDACPPSIIPFASIGLFAGLRTAEIERLSWGDVDLDRGFIHVAASKSKTAQRRFVTISENLRSWLESEDCQYQFQPRLPRELPPLFRAAHKAARIDPWPRTPCATPLPATTSPRTRTPRRRRSSLATWTPAYCSPITESWSPQTPPPSFGTFLHSFTFHGNVIL